MAFYFHKRTAYFVSEKETLRHKAPEVSTALHLDPDNQTVYTTSHTHTHTHNKQAYTETYLHIHTHSNMLQHLQVSKYIQQNVISNIPAEFL